MKRIKKILAVAAAAAVLTSFGNAGAAKAAASASSCPPHGSYEDRPVSIGNPWTTTHKITITSSSGAEKTVLCTVSHQNFTIGVYCTRCNELISTYSYEEVWHSVPYCPEG